MPEDSIQQETTTTATLQDGTGNPGGGTKPPETREDIVAGKTATQDGQAVPRTQGKRGV